MNFFRKQKKLRAKNSVGDNMVAWVGSLAHEIKNPLNSMKINLQLLQEDISNSLSQPDSSEIEGPKILKKLEVLGGEVDRLEQILNDFLGLARLPQSNIQSGNISLLLDELLDFIEPETQQSKIELVKELEKDLPTINFDSDQMKQAMLNIVLNANQAMPHGGKLTVKVYQKGDYISIDIIDTGNGIPSDRIDKLFDLFYSTKKNGTGLGLSIARKIINMHKGRIQVESQEGKGTTFSILLPIGDQ